uniref:LINE-1 type transposase domain-containing 1 n=1 Tax=Cyprinus carpio TaxID=7962 RepID=A0A8C1WL38_CYPCA
TQHTSHRNPNSVLRIVLISLLMSSSKSATKRECTNSPIKKRPKEILGLSTEELDDAILRAVKQALTEQQQHFDKAVQAAVKGAVDNLVIPQLTDLKCQVKQANESVSSLARDVEELGKSSQKANSRFDSLHATVRAQNQDIRDHDRQIASLSARLTEMEDRNRRSNLRLVGLPESEEGSDPIGFLKKFLPLWIPSLAGREIKIERAHRLYNRRETEASRSRTFIFKLLDYGDRQAILKGAREAYPVKHKERILSFYPDFSNETMIGLRPFLVYTAELKLTHQGQPLVFKTPQEAEKFLDSKEVPGTPLMKPSATASMTGHQRNLWEDDAQEMTA